MLLLAGLSSSSQGPLHRLPKLPHKLVAGNRGMKERERKKTRKQGDSRLPSWKQQAFYILILGVTCHYFHHILLIRSKSVSPAHTKKEQITQVGEWQEAGIPGRPC